MIARLDLFLPFSVSIPEKEKFTIYKYNDSGYAISIYPPMKTDKVVQQGQSQVLINGNPSFDANGLRIYFKRDSFDRREEIECDPPFPLINKTVNLFLSKLRFVTHSSKVHPITFPHVSWYLSYLNDDGSKLGKEEGLVSGRFVRSISFSYTAVNNEIWEDIFSLPLDYFIPPWENLLLDAQESLPEVGPTIVLTATALEVFVSYILNTLSKNNTIPHQLWEWINQRQMRCKDPNVEDEFDILLKTLLGTSLKENPELWEAFKNTKEARNTFVHEGVAQIGRTPISEDDVRRLLQKAREIIRFIKDKLPENLQWSEHKHSVKIKVTKPIFDKNA